jgi:acyl carrier protein
MPDRASVQTRIAAWFLAKLNVEIPSPDTDLFETGVLDSLGFVDLMVCLEQEFGVTIALEQVEVDNFRSIERIVDIVVDGAEGARRAPSAGYVN